jgi:predicted nucleic acid-binding protein
VRVCLDTTVLVASLDPSARWIIATALDGAADVIVTGDRNLRT